MTNLIEGLISAELTLLGVPEPTDEVVTATEADAPATEFDVADYRSAAG